MAKLIITVPSELKRRMDLLDVHTNKTIDWNKVAANAFRTEMKEMKESARLIDKDSFLRTKLIRIPPKVTAAWGSFFDRQEPRVKKSKRKPF